MKARRREVSGLKHLPFFEVLASAPEGSDEAKRATAGLLTLRMLDHWVLAGPSIVEPESVSVRSVRQSIMALDAKEPARESLIAVVNLMQMLRQVDLVPVLPRVFAFGQLLERHYGDFKLAADTYDSVTGLGDAELDAELVMDTYYRLGYCRRRDGALDQADAAYDAMGKVATRRKDRARALRAQNGLGAVLSMRGEYARADELLAEVVERAAKAGFVAEQSMALHNRAVVASKRGDFDAATTMAHGAFGLCQDLTERDRILFDLGAFLLESGRASAAEDAFRVLELTAASEDLRRLAVANLAIGAARFGDWMQVEAAIRRVDTSVMPPSARVSFHVELAAGAKRLHVSVEQFAHEQEAAALIERHGLPSVPAVRDRISDVCARVLAQHTAASRRSGPGVIEGDLQALVATAAGGGSHRSY